MPPVTTHRLGTGGKAAGTDFFDLAIARGEQCGEARARARDVDERAFG
jgi:hypothetical protein